MQDLFFFSISLTLLFCLLESNISKKVTYQMLKLKLGPHDNNGMIDTYSNGVNSPLSVLCRSSKVSGVLSFLKPLLFYFISFDV